VLCLDTTLLRKFENENKKQNKKNLRLKIYGKIRNGRLKLEPSVLIKKKRVVLYLRYTKVVKKLESFIILKLFSNFSDSES